MFRQVDVDVFGAKKSGRDEEDATLTSLEDVMEQEKEKTPIRVKNASVSGAQLNAVTS